MKVLPWLAAVLLLVVRVETNASIFFSTDPETDELVRIDSATGAVTTVGPLGFDAADVDLISVGSRLFALNSDFEVRVDLHEINTATGASISSVQVHSAAGNTLLAEGLAQVNGQLKIGLRVAGAPFPSRSNALGDLEFNGLVTKIETNASSFTNAGLDFDALGVNNATGQLYGSDGIPFNRAADTDFFTVSESPLSINVFRTITAIEPVLNIDDVVVQGNTLFAVGNELHLLNLSSNAFSTIDLGGAGSYSGLAVANPSDYLLTVEYQTPEVTGPLIAGFDPLPATITAQFTLSDIAPGQTTIGLDQVVSFDLTLPGGGPTRDDLDSFELALDAGGSATNLNWGVQQFFGIDVLNNNFTLEITGTDPATQEEFRYFWSESTNAFAPVPGLIGDYNDDGTVNAADYTVWRDNLGATVALPNDPLDGPIGQSQYDNWRVNFGKTAASAAAADVPEPGAAAMLFVIALCLKQRPSPRLRRGYCGVRV